MALIVAAAVAVLAFNFLWEPEETTKGLSELTTTVLTQESHSFTVTRA